MNTGSEPADEYGEDNPWPQDGSHRGHADAAATKYKSDTAELIDDKDEIPDADEQALGERDADTAKQSEGYGLKAKVMNFNRFIDDTAKGLDPISAMIWLTLFRFARGGIAWASQETIAGRLGISPTTVYRHISILKKKKLLRVVSRGHRGGRSSTYQLGILPLQPVAKRPERSATKPR